MDWRRFAHCGRRWFRRNPPLSSTKLGFEVGVRINIDVLNAENQVYVTRRDLAKAALDTIIAQFRLKAAVGTLSDDDVVAANALLDPAATSQ